MNGFYRKIYFKIFLSICFIISLIVFTLFSIDQVIDEKHELVSARAEELILTQKISHEISMLFAAMPIYAFSGDESILTSINRNRRDFSVDFELLKSRTTNLVEKDKLEEIFLAEKNLYEAAKVGLSMSKKGATAREVNEYFNGLRLLKDNKSLISLLENLVDTKTLDFQNAKNEDTQLSKKVLIGLGVISFICIIFAVFINSLIIKNLKMKEREEERLVYISNARKEIVDTVSHDLKNPLSSIKLGIQFIEKKLFNNSLPVDADIVKGMTVILRSVDKMDKMITDLLDHTKIEAGNLILEPMNGDIAGLANDVIEQFKLIAQSKNINITLDLLNEGKNLFYDPIRVEQVLSNIIGNALKFTPAGGDIHVSIEFNEDFVVISIRDSGKGMKQEQLEHIFDRYWQEPKTSKYGNGLGLAISKVVVETHHGEIWAESVLGKGSTFYFSLPLKSSNSNLLH